MIFLLDTKLFQKNALKWTQAINLDGVYTEIPEIPSLKPT